MEQSTPRRIKIINRPTSKSITIGLLLPRENEINQYLQYLRQFGDVRLLLEKDLYDDLDLVVIPDTDVNINTASKAFVRDSGGAVVRTHIQTPSILEYFMEYIYPCYMEKNTPIFGIGNSSLVLAAKNGCTLYPHVPHHLHTKHPVIAKFASDDEPYTVKVDSNHISGIDTHEENLITLASAIDRNNIPYLIEAFKFKDVKVSGVLWLPHMMENHINSEFYKNISKGHTLGDPISYSIVKSLLNNDD